MKIWADDETLSKLLSRWYYSGDKLDRHWPSYYDFTLDCLYIRREGVVIQYRRNLLVPCKFNHGQEVAWISSEKVPSVSVLTQDRVVTWKGTYCSGITGILYIGNQELSQNTLQDLKNGSKTLLTNWKSWSH
eukprot:5694540-Ditylum_brightwellii.AAC.1